MCGGLFSFCFLHKTVFGNGQVAITHNNPITEDLVLPMAERIQNAPIQQWDAKQMLEKVNQLALSNAQKDDDEF